MSGIANYCPDEVSVLLAGFIPLDGFIDGTFIEITKDVQPFRSVTSADGKVSRLYSHSGVYNVSLTLMSSSGGNDILTKLWQLDEITQKGKFPLMIKDKTGTDLFFSATTWIEEVPTLSKGEVIDERTWVLKSVESVINVGGNQKASDLINDITNIAVGALPSLRGIF